MSQLLAALGKVAQLLSIFNLSTEVGTTVHDLGFVQQELQHNGLTRNFLEYAPESLGDNPSLIITYHGLAGNNWVDYEPIIPTFAPLLGTADEKGYLLLAPEAKPISLLGVKVYFRGWKDYGKWWLQPGAKVDDVGFTASLIDWAVENHNVNRDRVFVIGVSGGGSFTYRLLNERSDLFAAAAVLTATLQTEVPEPEGYIPTPLITIIGTKDPYFRYEGGKTLPFDTRSMDETLGYFAKLNGLSGNRAESHEIETESCEVEHIVYESTDAPVESYTVVGGGHLPPGTEILPLYASMIRLQFGPIVCIEEFVFVSRLVKFFELFSL